MASQNTVSPFQIATIKALCTLIKNNAAFYLKEADTYEKANSCIEFLYGMIQGRINTEHMTYNPAVTDEQPHKSNRQPQQALMIKEWNNISKGYTSLLRAKQAGIDTQGKIYAVSCDVHGTFGSADSLTVARHLMSHPFDFCADCKLTMELETVRLLLLQYERAIHPLTPDRYIKITRTHDDHHVFVWEVSLIRKIDASTTIPIESQSFASPENALKFAHDELADFNGLNWSAWF